MSRILQLKYYPFPSLRQKASPFVDFNQAPAYFEQMLQIMYNNNGCGLAANQVGLLSRVFVMDTSEEKDSPLFIANPEIISSSSKTHQIEEGCLSLPGIAHLITRPYSIVLKYIDEHGATQEKEFSGLSSSCVQHEIDHLNGQLFPDRAAAHESAKLWKKYKAPKELTLKE